MTAGRKRAVFVCTLLFAAAARIALSAPIPSVERFFVYDDALYARTADALARGDWLGPYDRATLSKAPGYSFLLAGGRILGWSRRTTDDVLFAGAVLVAAYGLRRTGVGRVATTCATAAALFHPALYGAASAWTVRESCVAGQLLILFGLASVVVAEGSTRARVGAALLHGVVLGWFWFTREESVWMLAPSLVSFSALLIVERRRRGAWRGAWIAATLLAAPSVGGVFGVEAALRAGNEAVYGAPVSIEEADPDYRAAFAALLRVADREADFLPIRKTSRDALYEVSPAFARLKPTLESDAFRFPGAADEKGDVFFAYWPFLLRDAMADAGLYRSLPETKSFYARLAAEVDAGCDGGRVAGAAPFARGRLPSFRSEAFGPWFRAFGRRAIAVSRAEFSSAASPTPPPPPIDAETQGLFDRVLGGFAAPPLDATVSARYDAMTTAHETWATISADVFLWALVALAVSLALARFVGLGRGAFVAAYVVASVAGLAGVMAYVETHLWRVAPDYLLRLHPFALLAAVIAFADALSSLFLLVVRSGTARVRFGGPVLALAALGAAVWIGTVAREAAVELARGGRYGVPIGAFRDVDDAARPQHPLVRFEGGARFDSDDGASFGVVLPGPDAAVVLRPRTFEGVPGAAILKGVRLPPATNVTLTFRATDVGSRPDEGAEEAAVRGESPNAGPFVLRLDGALRPDQEFRLSATSADGLPVRVRIAKFHLSP